MTLAPARDTTTGPSADDVREAMIARLSRQSVDKRFEAYVDIDWDDPDNVIDPSDPRWTLWDFDPLGSTEWYRALSPAEKGRIGLYRVAACMKVGEQFENWLQSGLLIIADNLDNGDTSFRYIHHEISEESQHSMMFQELVNRSGLPVQGMPWWIRPLRPAVMVLARRAPALFFVLVLGGEDPIDHVQRQQLKGDDTHPIAEKIMRIHVTEEARHLSFARHTLKAKVPELGWFSRRLVGIAAPVVLGIMVRLMVVPQADLVRHCGVPTDVMRAANRSDEGRKLLTDSVAKPRKLLRELGLVDPLATLLWKAMGIWDSDKVNDRTDRTGASDSAA